MDDVEEIKRRGLDVADVRKLYLNCQRGIPSILTEEVLIYSSAVLALMKNIRVARKTGVIFMRFRRRALFARERA